jgi:hypothetical protein
MSTQFQGYVYLREDRARKKADRELTSHHTRAGGSGRVEFRGARAAAETVLPTLGALLAGTLDDGRRGPGLRVRRRAATISPSTAPRGGVSFRSPAQLDSVAIAPRFTVCDGKGVAGTRATRCYTETLEDDRRNNTHASRQRTCSDHMLSTAEGVADVASI